MSDPDHDPVTSLIDGSTSSSSWATRKSYQRRSRSSVDGSATVVVDVVRVDEDVAVLAGEQVRGAVREERRHRQRRGPIGGRRAVAGGVLGAIHRLVGRDHHRLALRLGAGPGDHGAEIAERHVRFPHLDVHGVLAAVRRGPRREVVDVVEHEVARRAADRARPRSWCRRRRRGRRRRRRRGAAKRG